MNMIVADVIQGFDRGVGDWAGGFVHVGGRDYRYEVKHYSEGSEFGIDGGRVSKLWIQRIFPPVVVCNYDRGWDVEPKRSDPYDMAAYNAVLKKYN